MTPELLERLQDMHVSRAISESTWGYPVIGGIHVLAIALFGGTLLIRNLQLARDARSLKIAGLVLIASTGALLFAAGAVHYYASTAFRIKMALLVLLFLNWISGRRRSFALALWAAVVFAARGIAFF